MLQEDRHPPDHRRPLAGFPGRWQAAANLGGGSRAMGKHWRKYSVGKYRLGRLLGQAVVVWKDEQGPHRLRLGSPATEGEARALLDAWVRDELAVTAVTKRQTVGELYAAYQTDRIEDGKKGSNFIDSWKALAPRFDSLPIDAITTAICKDYARDRLAAGVSGNLYLTYWNRVATPPLNSLVVKHS